MKTSFLIIALLFLSNVFAQPDRGDIISKKIKAITSSYWTPDSSQKIEEKKYYTYKGDDSVQYYCGKQSFTFKTILEKNDKVQRLERYTVGKMLDELHIYKYNKDGSYSIEVVAHGSGTILLSKYNKFNKCLEETFSSIETLHYEYEGSKLKSILYNEKDEKPNEVAVVEYNNHGLIEKIIGKGRQAQFQHFKYNSFGLVSEKTSTRNDENGKEEKQIIFYEYEFKQ
ncbi:MAG: hypothetical protein SGI83_06425 [Bacteroidota bacterium]|nr:hypothetical protein [Bacteroidota bacterium]